MDTLILNADGLPLSEIPLSVIPWTTAMRHVFLGKVKVIKEYDDWIVRSQYLELKVPSIVIRTDHVKWNKKIKYSRNNVFLRDDFSCQLQITNRCKEAKGKGHGIFDLTVDHVIPASKGGKTTWTNVCTACKDCNGKKGNDGSIVPRRPPHKPTYYEILSKRKNMPIQIKDKDWLHYIDWPEDMVKLMPHHSNIKDIFNDDFEDEL